MYSRPRRFLFQSAFLLVVAGVFVPQALRGATIDSPRELAGTILRLASLHGGLVVHVGCGDGTLTADFSSSMRPKSAA